MTSSKPEVQSCQFLLSAQFSGKIFRKKKVDLQIPLTNSLNQPY